MNNTFNLIYDISPFESENLNFNIDSIETFIINHNLDFARIREIEDIEKNPKAKFYHLCTIKSYLSVFITNNDRLPISDVIINLLRKYKNFNVIFLTENESDNSDVLYLFQKQIDKFELKSEQFVVINDNEDLKKINKDLGTNLLVHTGNILHTKTLQIMSEYESNHNSDKKYLFMCNNRRLHPHRFGLLCWLKKYNLLDSINWSFLRGYEIENRKFSNGKIWSHFLDVVFNEKDKINLADEIEYVSKIGIKKDEYELNYEIDSGEIELDFDKSYEINSYKNAFINIITESKFDSQNITHITEKSFVPFYFYQLPIFVSSVYHVRILKEKYNFDLFEDLINHDYDIVHTHRERLCKIVEEIKRLNDNKEMVIDFYKKNKHRFEENKRKCIEISKSKTDYFFYESLIYKKKLNIVYDDIFVKKDFVKDYFTVFLGHDKFELYDINHLPYNTEENYFYFSYYWNCLFDQIFQHKRIPISDKSIELLKNRENFYCILINDNECDANHIIRDVEMGLSVFDINPNKLFLVNANEKINELKEKHTSKINVKNLNVGYLRASKQLSDFDSPFYLEREKTFMFYNRSLKPHRLAMLLFLKKNNILDDIDWSFLRGKEFRETYVEPKISDEEIIQGLFGFFYRTLNENSYIDLIDEIKYFSSFDRKKSEYEIDYNFDVPPFHTEWDLTFKNKPYKHSYINIVSESHFTFNDIVHFTEKSLIPFYFNQMPIIIASPNHIKKLKKSFDFDFYEDFINHSYDDEMDNDKRIRMVIDEIIRLNKNKDLIKKFFIENKERFIKNQEKVRKIKDMKFVRDYYLSLIKY
jgi:hypothetical protein